MDDVEGACGHANKRKKRRGGSGTKDRARAKASGTIKEGYSMKWGFFW